MSATLGIVGAGRMGAALARAALAGGAATRVWNRTASKIDALVEMGAVRSETVLETVVSSEVLVIMVNDVATSERLVREPSVASALRSKLLVDLTSGTPRQARERAAWASDRGIRVLDGTVLVTPDLVGTPRCVTLYAGPKMLLDENEPLLAFGGRAVHAGEDPGHAAALDVALITSMWGALFGALQGAALCEAEGIGVDRYASFVGTMGAVTTSAVAGQLGRMAKRNYSADGATRASLAIHHGGIEHLLEACREAGLSTALPRAFAELTGAAMRAGHADDELAVVSTFMRGALA